MVSWISKGDHRLAMLITSVYFVIGLAILMGVDIKRGRDAALQPGLVPVSASAANLD
jgi:UMF1 family MFS transporter